MKEEKSRFEIGPAETKQRSYRTRHWTRLCRETKHKMERRSDVDLCCFNNGFHIEQDDICSNVITNEWPLENMVSNDWNQNRCEIKAKISELDIKTTSSWRSILWVSWKIHKNNFGWMLFEWPCFGILKNGNNHYPPPSQQQQWRTVWTTMKSNQGENSVQSNDASNRLEN